MCEQMCVFWCISLCAWSHRSPWRLQAAAAVWMSLCVCVCIPKPLGKTERVRPVDTPADELPAFLSITHNLTGQSASHRAVWSDSNVIKNLVATFCCPLSRVSFNMSTSCCCSLRFVNMQAISDGWEKILHLKKKKSYFVLFSFWQW